MLEEVQAFLKLEKWNTKLDTLITLYYISNACCTCGNLSFVTQWLFI